MKVTVLHPGAMGSTIAMALLSNGHEVQWVSSQRSDATKERAAKLGLKELNSLEEAAAHSDVVISICSGAGVIPHATEMIRLGYKGIFADFNYVGSKNEISDLSSLLYASPVRYVEGSIYGWPFPAPTGHSDERILYLGSSSCDSQDTLTVASLFEGSMFDVSLCEYSAKQTKEDRVASEITKFYSYVDHGWGVVEFPNVAPEIDDNFVDQWLERRRSVEPSDYTLNDEGLYVSRGGYTFTKRQIQQAPERYMNLTPSGCPEEDIEFRDYLQKIMFNCIHAYTGIYPECKDAVWWGADGHVAVYGEDGQMGMHHDTAVGGATGNENPIFLTVSGSLLISDRCTGGDLYFSHLVRRFPPEKGSAIFYPSSYMGAHAVSPVFSGTRVSYLEFYGHGTRSGQTRRI